MARAITEAAAGSTQARRWPSRSGATTARSAPGSTVPAFAFPEPAAGALGRVARYADWRAGAGGRRADARRGIDLASGRRSWPTPSTSGPRARCCRCGRRPTCSPPMASRWRRRAPWPRSTPPSPPAAALGYPVALKASGLERLARSESGGVALDVQGPEQLRGLVRAHGGGPRRRHGRGRRAADGAGRSGDHRHRRVAPRVRSGRRLRARWRLRRRHRRPPGAQPAAHRSRRRRAGGVVTGGRCHRRSRRRRRGVAGAARARRRCWSTPCPRSRAMRLNPVLVSSSRDVGHRRPHPRGPGEPHPDAVPLRRL